MAGEEEGKKSDIHPLGFLGIMRKIATMTKGHLLLGTMTEVPAPS